MKWTPKTFWSSCHPVQKHLELTFAFQGRDSTLRFICLSAAAADQRIWTHSHHTLSPFCLFPGLCSSAVVQPRLLIRFPVVQQADPGHSTDQDVGSGKKGKENGRALSAVSSQSAWYATAPLKGGFLVRWSQSKSKLLLEEVAVLPSKLGCTVTHPPSCLCRCFLEPWHGLDHEASLIKNPAFFSSLILMCIMFPHAAVCWLAPEGGQRCRKAYRCPGGSSGKESCFFGGNYSLSWSLNSSNFLLLYQTSVT